MTHRLPRAAKLAVVAVTMFLAGARLGAGELELGREYEIKAGFLYNFVRLVEWPEDAFASSVDNLRVVIIGHDPFDGALDRLVAGKLVNNHRISLVYTTSIVPVSDVHVVFIAASMERHLPAVLLSLRDAPALTISDIGGFAGKGGVIELVRDGRSIRFVVNRAAAGQHRLRISSRLLSLATIIGDAAPDTGPGRQPPSHADRQRTPAGR